jgi:hypothetical protein
MKLKIGSVKFTNLIKVQKNFQLHWLMGSAIFDFSHFKIFFFKISPATSQNITSH